MAPVSITDNAVKDRHSSFVHTPHESTVFPFYPKRFRVAVAHKADAASPVGSVSIQPNGPRYREKERSGNGCAQLGFAIDLNLPPVVAAPWKR
jgi:hypothetical protein